MTTGSLIPARPLAAQAHALHAAAVFLEHGGTAGLSVTVDASAFITVHVPDQLGDAAARAVLVTALAGEASGDTVRSIALGCTARYRITGHGQLAGHPLIITTPPADTP